MLAVAGSLFMTSCGTSQKAVEQTPVSTYVQPCSECLNQENTLRGWGVGKSDSQATARKKAQAMASADLAAQLQKTVRTAIENYSAVLSEGNASASKALLVEKTEIIVNQTLRGVTTICDRWAEGETAGQYTNYLVLEINPEAYIKAVSDALTSGGVSVDGNLLRELFLKEIGK